MIPAYHIYHKISCMSYDTSYIIIRAKISIVLRLIYISYNKSGFYAEINIRGISYKEGIKPEARKADGGDGVLLGRG